jgi:hypothetical protein
MCVAVIVESKNRVPRAHLKAMHEANPHGGGIAWYEGDKAQVVMFRKGVTWEEIDAIQDKLPRPFLLHFRIATRGAKIPELTHPFPLGMQAFTEDLVGIANMGVLIHNGTWSDFRKFVPGGIDANSVSDTQVAAYVAGQDESVLNEVVWSNAIMKPGGDVIYRGQWTKEDGNLYSNMHWKRELEWERFMSRGRVIDARTIPEVKSHQKGRTQSNGHTVTRDLPTQFNKAGKGVNTTQSNGKTMKENREHKKGKQSAVYNDNYYSEGESPYSRARENYKGLSLVNETKSTVPVKGWEGERLFNKDEIDGYPWEGSASADVDTALDVARTPTVDLGKYLGPSIPCPDCGENITQIPCQCGMDSEKALQDALDDELTQLLSDEPIEVAIGDIQDLADVEDMNAYGTDDVMHDSYLNPEWDNIQTTIRDQGIKILDTQETGE